MCFLACDFKIFDNGAPVLPSGRDSSVVLGLPWNSANPFFKYLTRPVSSISALILILDELIDFDCSSSCSSLLVFRYLDRSLRSYVSIGLVVLQCRAPLVLDSKCLVGINTLYKIAPPVYHRTRWPSCWGFCLLLHGSFRFSRRFLQIFLVKTLHSFLV